jgi:hypothetical protein
MSPPVCPDCQRQNPAAVIDERFHPSQSIYLSSSLVGHPCPLCGDTSVPSDRISAIGQLTTGITGLLISGFIMIQQLSTIIGLYRLKLFSELGFAGFQLGIAVLFLVGCIYLIQVSILQAVKLKPRASRVRLR